MLHALASGISCLPAGAGFYLAAVRFYLELYNSKQNEVVLVSLS